MTLIASAAGRALMASMTVAMISGCSPTLDWRDVRLGVEASAAGVRMTVSSLRAQFPCRPEKVERVARLDDQAVPSQMHVCKAGDATWAVSRFALPDPSRMVQAQEALRAALVRNAQASGSEAISPVDVPGMTPSAAALRVAFTGRQPDGALFRIDSAFVAHGPEVVQITVMSSSPDWQTLVPARDQFLASLRW